MIKINITIDVQLNKSSVVINPDDPATTEIFEGDVKALQKFLRKFKISDQTERPRLGGTPYDK